MAVYRNVHLTFWTDSKVIDDFTPEDKYFYLYLLTNPHTNLLGCYEITLKQMSDETGYSRDSVDKLMKRMIVTHNRVAYCDNTKEILIYNWYKHNWTSSDKQYKAIVAQIEKVKDTVFKDWLKDRVSIRYPYPMHTTDTDTGINNINNLNNSKEEKEDIKFIDTVKEVIDYLNTVCGTHYRYNTQKTQALIRARLNEGFAVDDFKKVIENKQKQWGNDPRWSDFLRPETLFGNKFEGYLNQKSVNGKTVASEVMSWL